MTPPKKSETDRREFLKNACVTVAGASLLGASALGYSCKTSGKPANDSKSQKPDTTTKSKSSENNGAPPSTVVLKQDQKVFLNSGHDENRVRTLVNAALMDLTGAKKPDEAFRALFKPDDRVAIKLNCLAGPGLSSSVSVVNALVLGLRSIGIEHGNIYIFERTSKELERAGFELNRSSDSKPRCIGNDEAGFGQEIEFSGQVGSLFAKILADRATALINVPVLKDHDLSGIGCGMKNLFGVIHNPNRYHDNNCDPYVADVSAHPYIKNKLRLVLADGLTAQYNGGPAAVMKYQWKPAIILASRDPVALDRIAQKTLEDERAKHGMASFQESNRPPKWLDTAAKYHLGENRLEKITLKY